MGRPRKILTISHSYCVALNRRLAHEMARVGQGNWEVTAVAPSFFQGDLRPIALEDFPGEASLLRSVPAHFSKRIHLMLYGRELQTILSERWDLVHCWEEPFIFAGGQVARWLPKDTSLVFATFQNIEKSYPPPFSWIENYAMRRASGWIAFGHTVEETLSRRPLYQKRAQQTIPLGVDLSRFYPDREAGQRVRELLGWSDDGPPVIGFMGRFVPAKGIELLMKVLDGLEKPWRALFIGAGPLEKDLRNWALRYPDRIKVVTDVKHDGVPAYLNAMDVMCAPSQTTAAWREQLGRMLIEAFACGVPVVASDSGEIPYVVGDAGVVVPEADEAAWMSVISELLENPQRRADLARRGLERVHTHFAWPVIARQHLDFFENVLENRSASKN
ncbi:MAG TPA: glycosyltransferase family 4 protein [Pyrinomonadaceae bacterium]|nr:glycosyltransferase family 4 protein [Pyrinomonadaceae bacterium]